jgi:hypothetical protein
MSKDLTNSPLDRQNILNNPYAVSKVEEHLALGGLTFEGETVFSKSQVAELLEVDDRTVERYLASNGEELKQNGYRLLKSNVLKDFKQLYVSDIHVGDKAPTAEGKISKELLGEIVESLINDEDYPEHLKLLMFEAIDG